MKNIMKQFIINNKLVMTELAFLSHASVLASSNGKSLLMDPWLIGSLNIFYQTIFVNKIF